MSIYDKYLKVVMAECIKPITSDSSQIFSNVRVGEKYRIGIRYNPVLCKEVYYLIDITNAFGRPIYVEKESGYFKEEELSSISFILT